MDDLELATELVELFLSDAPLQLATLSRCINESHTDQLRRSAHQLKGSCLTVGADEMAEICKQLETASESLPHEDLSRLGEALGRSFEEIKTELHGGSWQGKFAVEPSSQESGPPR